jgi:hypothetical protein
MNKITDKRTKVRRDITYVSILIIGIIIGALLNKFQLELKKPTWASQQAVLPGGEYFISPIPDIPLRISSQGAEIKQVARPVYELSQKAKSCVKQSPVIAQKLLDKFNEPEIIELISRESSLNNFAINPKSGACGLGQAYPCSKMNCTLDNVDCQIDWIHNYISNRYGNVKNALDFHIKHNWY